MRSDRRRRYRAAVLTLAVTLLTAPWLTACSGDDDSSADPAEPVGSQATEDPGPLVTTATIGKVTGKLGKDNRPRVRKQVRKAVDSWFDAAYVGGDYPRTNFSDAWAGFTDGAAARARRDKALLSNHDIGAETTAVEATTRKVTVDVLAVRGHAVGATARVVLKFSTEGDTPRQVEVRGRLYLSPTPDGWRIFGYDVTKAGA